MNSRPMDFATLLFRQLPEVFRERDNSRQADGSLAPGDLARLLATWGDLLDALYRSLLQRYYDIFPEQEGEPDAEGLARGCQPWVLPYLARLLDVTLISPLEAGQRAEIGRAIAWRQRKGTPLAVEDIADQVAGMEVEIREGFRKLAVTPWAGFTLLPESVFGEPDGSFPREFRLHRVEHPGLPAGTVDFRRASRAIRAADGDPAAKNSTFGGMSVPWRQKWPHGVPCFSGSFQDVAAHSADLRTPSASRGHAHPRRVVLHAPPFPGFFAPQPANVEWNAIRDAVLAGDHLPDGLPLRLTATEAGRSLAGTAGAPVCIHGELDLDAPLDWDFSNLWFDDAVRVSQGRVRVTGCAFRELDMHTVDAARAVATLTACLAERVIATGSLVSMEYVTLLGSLVCERLLMSDSILMPMPRRDPLDNDVPAGGCIRYSRLPHIPIPPDPADPAAPNDPQWIARGRRSMLRVHGMSCTTLTPIFWNTGFGEPGCAVLHPAGDEAIRFGAEDDGEMGACHALAYTLRERAVIDKLKDFLPVGIEAVLAPDGSMVCAPPRGTIGSTT